MHGLRCEVRPPLPKVRATRRSCTPARPHAAQRNLDEVDRDDVEDAREADLDDRFGFAAIKGAPLDDDLGFARFAIFLAINDVCRVGLEAFVRLRFASRRRTREERD